MKQEWISSGHARPLAIPSDSPGTVRMDDVLTTAVDILVGLPNHEEGRVHRAGGALLHRPACYRAGPQWQASFLCHLFPAVTGPLSYACCAGIPGLLAVVEQAICKNASTRRAFSSQLYKPGQAAIWAGLCAFDSTCS